MTTSLSFSTAGEFRSASLAPSGRELRIILIALLAAILLHVSAILSVLVEWPDFFARPIERRDIPVELVFEPPPKEDPRENPPQELRESGGDPSLAQGRPADAAPTPVAPPPNPATATPAEAASPLAEPAPVNPTGEFAPPLRKPEPPAPPAPPKQAEAPPAPPRPAPPAEAAKAPTPRQPSQLRIIGQGGGDAYLNQIKAMIDVQRTYPDIANPMRLSGIAVFEIRLRRDGEIDGLILRRSTGAGPLDEEGRKIVRRAGPFPPVPPDIRANLGSLVVLTLDLPIHP